MRDRLISKVVSVQIISQEIFSFSFSLKTLYLKELENYDHLLTCVKLY